MNEPLNGEATAVIWHTLYDVRDVPVFDWEMLSIGAGLALLALSLWITGGLEWLGMSIAGNPSRRTVRLVGALGFIIAAGSSGGGALMSYVDHEQLVDALETHQYTTVEATVTDFIPGDPGGHKAESWTVRSGGEVHRYSYIWSMESAGFHQSAGPIHAGMRVRIADVGGDIARLEVAD